MFWDSFENDFKRFLVVEQNKRKLTLYTPTFLNYLHPDHLCRGALSPPWTLLVYDFTRLCIYPIRCFTYLYSVPLQTGNGIEWARHESIQKFFKIPLG